MPYFKVHNVAIRAIIIDDNLNIVTVLNDLLEIIGLDVVGQGFDGNEAAELYKSLKPDVIFTDIMMPIADGFVGIEKIKAFDPNAKIIVMTADLTQETSDRLESLDISALIYKPFSIKDIKETLIEKCKIQF